MLRFPIESMYVRLSSIGQTVFETIFSTELLIEVEDSVRFNVNPVYDEICEGTVVELKANSTNGVDYDCMWEKQELNNPYKLLSTQNNITDEPNGSVNYKVTMTGKYCPTLSKILAVAVDKRHRNSVV